VKVTEGGEGSAADQVVSRQAQSTPQAPAADKTTTVPQVRSQAQCLHDEDIVPPNFAMLVFPGIAASPVLQRFDLKCSLLAFDSGFII